MTKKIILICVGWVATWAVFHYAFNYQSIELVIYNPFIPLVFHISAAFFYYRKMIDTVPDRFYPLFDHKMNVILILIGFSFTSISLLLAIFKDDTAALQSSILFLAFSLTCFFTAYFALHYRTEYIYGYISRALTDCGLWCILLGLYHIFQAWGVLKNVEYVVVALMIIYCVHILFSLILTIIENKPKITPQAGA